jgi:hypothetical protein
LRPSEEADEKRARFAALAQNDDGRKLMVKDPGKITKLESGSADKEQASQIKKAPPLAQDQKTQDRSAKKPPATSKPAPKKE